MKRLIVVLSVLCCNPAFAQENYTINKIGKTDSAITNVLIALNNKKVRLKFDVIKINRNLGNLNVTNVYPDGSVIYEVTLNLIRKAKSPSSEEFLNDIKGERTNPWIFKKDTEATIHYIKLNDNDFVVDIFDNANRKVSIKFKLPDPEQSIEKMRKMLSYAFAFQSDLQKGMSINEVIDIRGEPKSRIDLGEKVILIYEDLKLIFNDGKLSDVQ